MRGASIVVLAILLLSTIYYAYSTEYIVKSTETSFLDLRGRGYVLSFYIPVDMVRSLDYFKLVFNNNTLYIRYIDRNTSVVQGIQVPAQDPFSPILTAKILKDNTTHDLVGFYFNTSLHNSTAQYMSIAIQYNFQSDVPPPAPGNPFIKLVERRNNGGTYNYKVIVNGSTVWGISNVERGEFSIKLYGNRIDVWVNANNTITTFNYTVKPHYIIYISSGDNGYIYPEITYHIHGYTYTFNSMPIEFSAKPKDIVYENDVLSLGDYIIWSGEINYINTSSPIRINYAVIEDAVPDFSEATTSIQPWQWVLLGLGTIFILVIVIIAFASSRRR